MMRKKFLLVLIIFNFPFIISAQDTLQKRNGEKLIVKILEVNINDVSYTRNDVPHGPTYVSAKSEIAKITYSSGQIDSFPVKQAPVPLKMIVPAHTIKVHPATISLTQRRGVYKFQGIYFSDTRLVPMIQSFNHPMMSAQIDQHALENMKFRKFQYVAGFGGAAVSLVAGVASIVLLTNSADNEFMVLGSTAMASSAVAVFVASQVVSVSFKLKRVRHANRVIELHNQTLQ